MIQAPDGLDLTRAHGLETIVWVVDARGMTHDRQAIVVRIDAPSSGDSRKMSSPPGPAASTIPSDTPKRILRGARLATTIT